MRKLRAAIAGVHGYVPPDVLSNAELAKMVDTSDEWIVERTGIKERRILKGKGLGTSHMGAQAVEGLLAKTATLLNSPKPVQKSQFSSVWAPLGDAQVMMTCTNCLRSFPIDTCEGTGPAKQSACIFCGVQLDVQLVAIGTASSGAA